MREKLIEYFRKISENYSLEPLEVNPKKAIEWLEKQGEVDEAHWQEVRERAAIAAMRGMLSNSSLSANRHADGNLYPEIDPKVAVRYANELIEELRKK